LSFFLRDAMLCHAGTLYVMWKGVSKAPFCGLPAGGGLSHGLSNKIVICV
jgi:hypothetical protein